MEEEEEARRRRRSTKKKKKKKKHLVAPTDETPLLQDRSIWYTQTLHSTGKINVIFTVTAAQKCDVVHC